MVTVKRLSDGDSECILIYIAIKLFIFRGSITPLRYSKNKYSLMIYIKDTSSKYKESSEKKEYVYNSIHVGFDSIEDASSAFIQYVYQILNKYETNI